jgi:hypothetical protein
MALPGPGVALGVAFRALNPIVLLDCALFRSFALLAADYMATAIIR